MDDPSTEPSSPQSNHPQPNHPQPDYPQSNHPQQPEYLPPNYPQPSYPQPSYPQPSYPPPAAPVREPWLEPGDVRAAAILGGVLVVLGLVAGLLWAAISPHGSGVVVTKTEIIPFEQENWIAADGRFAIITAIIGLVAGLAAWFWKSRRGPVLAAGLAVGAVLGSVLTAVVGRAVSSGHSTGAVNSGIRLHIVLQAHGLVAIEGVLALAAYLGGVLFAGPDDLGRPADVSLTHAPAGNPSAGNPSAGNPSTENFSAPAPGYGG